MGTSQRSAANRDCVTDLVAHANTAGHNGTDGDGHSHKLADILAHANNAGDGHSDSATHHRADGNGDGDRTTYSDPVADCIADRIANPVANPIAATGS